MKIKGFKPVPDCITVGQSKIHGLIAVTDINAGFDLGISDVRHSQGPDGFIRTSLSGFINHSDNPNCKCIADNDLLRLVTTKKIKKGNELTVSYRGWYDDDVLAKYK